MKIKSNRTLHALALAGVAALASVGAERGLLSACNAGEPRPTGGNKQRRGKSNRRKAARRAKRKKSKK
jgi:hypothetical protein